MKRLEVRQKYSAARRIFNSLLSACSVSSGDERLRLMLKLLHQICLKKIGAVTSIRMHP